MPEKLVLGIDLGTTYSCVARLDENERPVVLPNSDSEYTTPSVVHYEESGEAVVGKYAKKELDRDRDNVVTLIKRHMGEPDYTVHVRGQDFYPSQVSAVILRKIVEDALTEVGAGIPAEPPLADVVITVPAYFGTAERNATVEAGKMAGLNVLNIINEPTAAAIAYGVVNAGSQRTVLVYDLGGGTFDVTVIKVSANEIRVVATGGDNSLGGADWDQRIIEMLAEEFAVLYPDKGDPRTDREAGDSLTVLAEEVKKTLQKRESDTVTLVAHGERAKIEISRASVLERTDDLVTRTVDFVRQVMEAAAEKGVTHYDELLLVGGMSRFHIAARLAQEFSDLPEPRLMDPDQIVAKGAALYAAHQVAEISESETNGSSGDGRKLLGGSIPVIINVASKGYGIKAVDGEHDAMGHVEWLIRPNDEIPASPRETFQTVSHNQTSVNVQVFESTTDQLSPVIADHQEMVAGTLTGLPTGRPPGQPIDVYCNLGEDGILYVTATADGQELKLNAKISGATPQEALDAPLPNISR